MIDHLYKLIAKYADESRIALFEKEQSYYYSELKSRIEFYIRDLSDKGLSQGASVLIRADYSLESISLLTALAVSKMIAVPLASSGFDLEEIIKIAGIDAIYDLSEGDCVFRKTDNSAKHILLDKLRTSAEPGIIFFSSGSSGKPKAALHNLNNLLKKYSDAHKSYITLAFMLFDHIAGIDTLFYTLFAGGAIAVPTSRDAATVLKAIEKYRIEVMPVSPSFINLLLFASVPQDYDLSALKIVTFGSERMNATSLNNLRAALPSEVKIIQKYGATEFGSPVSRSKPDDPLWIKFDKEKFNYKIENGRLFVKTESSLLGYLTGESLSFTDGWLDTGDMAETDGEWLKILGRESDIINVGGQKVFPSEIEEILLRIDNIKNASVFAEANPIMGSIAGAKIQLFEEEPLENAKKRIRSYFKENSESYKTPVKIIISDEPLHTERFKKRT